MKSETLRSKNIGDTVTIRGISSPNATLRQRLLSLGLVEGREVCVTRRSLLGGTIGIELIGFSLALRISEAEAVAILV